MFKSIPESLVPARDGDLLLIGTDAGFFGKGATIVDAKRALYATGQQETMKAWRVFSVHPDTTVNELGELDAPCHHPPIMTAEFDPV